VLHDGKVATTAEQLMRSRYSAYVKQDAAYLHKTWHQNTRPSLKQLRQPEAVDWLGLSILRTELGTENDSIGLVEFIAKFAEQGTERELHETSRFIRERGKWYYLEGDYTT
jgi:SEC-C motif-containing protein